MSTAATVAMILSCYENLSSLTCSALSSSSLLLTSNPCLSYYLFSPTASTNICPIPCMTLVPERTMGLSGMVSSMVLLLRCVSAISCSLEISSGVHSGSVLILDLYSVSTASICCLSLILTLFL